METLFPQYVASLQRLSQMPVEFEGRHWVSQIDLLVDRVRNKHNRYQVEVDRANLFGRLTAPLWDAIPRMVRMQPVPPATPLENCISISSSGKIEPTLRDALHSQPDRVLVTFEEFRTLALKMRQMVIKGDIKVRSEDEIPMLLRGLALEG
ncbi:MAG: hypothetical protein HQ578_06505 [Chloroflexi bacterium]|nr:hypothetical protein [Chloroflexota bacterium]